MQRIAITGGCGFIGSALVRRLVAARTAAILNIDKLTYAASPDAVVEAEAYSGYRFRQLDICNLRRLSDEISEFRPDCIFHLAAESHVDRSIDAAGTFVHTNLVGTYAVLEAALTYWNRLRGPQREHFRLVHVSTDEVYGSLEFASAPFSASSTYDPSSPYAATKAGSDHLARAWQRTYGLPVIITNCCNNFGPFQFPEKLIPKMIIAALNGEKLPVYGAGTNVREWLFVEDHISALLAVGQRGRPGNTYLIGSGEELSNIELVRMICNILDCLVVSDRPHEALIEFVTDRPAHDLRYAIDSSRLRSELGWAPQRRFAEALASTVGWYLEHRNWWESLRRDRYDGQRLGLQKANS